MTNDPRARRENGWADVVRYLNDSPLPYHIISSESFSLADDAGIDRVAEALCGFDVQVVVTYRNPVDLQQSHLREWACGWFPYDPDAFLQAGLREPRFAYGDLIRRWGRAFGMHRVQPVFFENAIGDLPSALLATIDQADALAGVPVERLNTSYSWAFLEANMACARLLYGVASPTLFRSEVGPMLARGRDSGEPTGGDYLDQAQADAIVAAFAEEVGLLEKLCGPAPESYRVARRVKPVERRRWRQGEATLILRPMLMQRAAMLLERERIARMKKMVPQLRAIKARRAAIAEVLGQAWTFSEPLVTMDFTSFGGRHQSEAG